MYDFQPLAIDGIRLLKIHPKLRDGYIACTLNQYHHCMPPYDSLSYCWGDPKPTRKIYVNDSLVDIHEALWEFLDQMQRSQETENWIWTDFLCLNQRNNEEMGQQVPRMGQIYSQAKRTISWLGCNRSSRAPSPDLEEDFRHIAEKVAARGAAVESFFAQTVLPRWTRVTKMLTNRGTVELGPQDNDGDLPKPIKEVAQLSQGHMLQPIRRILSVPYWTRVWIAQEVALAKKVTLMFGRISMDFNHFLLTYKAYFYYMLRNAPRDCEELRVPIEARAAVHENNVTFQQVVRWANDCDASRPVDRIYGLLGLLARCGDGTNILPTSLTGTIDYTRDVREIYWNIALTSPFSIDPSTIDENDYIKVTERWVDLLPTLGQIMTCPFTPESLRYAYNQRTTLLSKTKAHLALYLVDICRQTVMTDSSIFIKEADAFSREFCKSWPTKRSAQRLWRSWSYHSEFWNDPTFQMSRLLSSLLLETSNGRRMDEKDQYQAALIGLKMSKMVHGRGEWTCRPHSRIGDRTWRGPGEEVDFDLDCSIGLAASQLPCYSLSNARDLPPPWGSHQCLIPDRYRTIDCPWQRASWELSLKDLCFRKEEGHWRGTLNVKYVML